MWNTLRSIFKNFFGPQSSESTSPRAKECPTDAFRNYDEEYYDETIKAPTAYDVDEELILDRKLIRQKFLEIIKYYNDVIMTNTMVFSEEELLDYQKKIFKLEKEREKYKLKKDEHSHIHVDEDFFKYILKKVETIQGTLGNFNKQLSFFYNKHRLTYDSVSILIIVLSSSLSFIEGVTLCFSEENTPSTIVSLIVSTSIAIMTSVLKFKNVKEKIEELVKMREKIHNCQAKLYTFDKELKTTIFLSSTNKGQNEHDQSEHGRAFV